MEFARHACLHAGGRGAARRQLRRAQAAGIVSARIDPRRHHVRRVAAARHDQRGDGAAGRDRGRADHPSGCGQDRLHRQHSVRAPHHGQRRPNDQRRHPRTGRQRSCDRARGRRSRPRDYQGDARRDLSNDRPGLHGHQAHLRSHAATRRVPAGVLSRRRLAGGRRRARADGDHGPPAYAAGANAGAKPGGGRIAARRPGQESGPHRQRSDLRRRLLHASDRRDRHCRGRAADERGAILPGDTGRDLRRSR